MSAILERSFEQAEHWLKLAKDRKLSRDEFQRRMDSGIISDVLDSAINWDSVDRDVVRVGSRPAETRTGRYHHRTFWDCSASQRSDAPAAHC